MTGSAEREGFEPSDPVSQVNSLAVSPIRPLSHLSSDSCPLLAASGAWPREGDRRRPASTKATGSPTASSQRRAGPAAPVIDITPPTVAVATTGAWGDWSRAVVRGDLAAGRGTGPAPRAWPGRPSRTSDGRRLTSGTSPSPSSGRSRRRADGGGGGTRRDRQTTSGPAHAIMGPATATLGRGILCLPVDGLDEMARVVRASPLGRYVRPEELPFNGHLTLARARRGRRVPTTSAAYRSRPGGRSTRSAWCRPGGMPKVRGTDPGRRDHSVRK